ncbi:TatD family hydrolase [Aliikangiella coralliicola]|uniref:TatD family deoxyribonuclease n=1 Tax=Aliikangiella coralliicola TaxID=2592383 RepID=A0A545UD57_9GAMM|nr:TatD family hydrolase [Aliikangiella coralliicola]TQV87396.1 TatD family deoxyribonuclease [Aliikangiella coralliicola]
MLVDSHCHLDRIDLAPFDGQLENAISAAKEAGVEQFLCVAINAENQPEVLKIAEAHEEIHASAGIHPLYTEGQEIDFEYLCEQAKHPKVVAIGETGLDYFYAEESAEKQQKLFRTHVQAAVKSELPLIIHTRDARKDTLEILRHEGAEKVGGVLHCFTESLAMAEEAMEMGFYVSFSGIVTFKNASELRQVAAKIPDDRILVETDSPYLTPVPHRGKPNSPMYVSDVAKCLAELRDVPYEAFCRQTTNNYRRLFFSE